LIQERLASAGEKRSGEHEAQASPSKKFDGLAGTFPGHQTIQ
jgi:hypothetical protein